MKSKYPEHIEKEYEKLFQNAMLRLARFMIPAIRRKIREETPVKTDQDFTQFLNDLMDGIRFKLLNSGYISKKLDSIFLNVQSWVTNQNVNMISRKKGVSDLTLELTIASIKQYAETDVGASFAEGFKARNLELVTLAGNEYIDGIYQVAERGYLNGESLKTMTESMKEFTGGHVNKAKFWARDQIGDAYAEYNRQSQKAAGINRYRWNTVGDNHVRSDHAELNGRIFDWSTGASQTGLLSKPGARHPGEDYNCRCWPEPILAGEE